MQGFFILGGALHATALAVIGFFVLFAASKSQGWLKRIGNILGAWLFILAVLAIVGAIAMGAMGHGMGSHRMWMHGGPPGPPPAVAPGNAAAAAGK